MLFPASVTLFLLSSQLAHAYPHAFVDDSVRFQDALVARDADMLYEEGPLYPREGTFQKHWRREVDFHDLPRRWVSPQQARARLLRRAPVREAAPVRSDSSSSYHTAPSTPQGPSRQNSDGSFQTANTHNSGGNTPPPLPPTGGNTPTGNTPSPGSSGASTPRPGSPAPPGPPSTGNTPHNTPQGTPPPSTGGTPAPNSPNHTPAGSPPGSPPPASPPASPPGTPGGTPAKVLDGISATTGPLAPVVGNTVKPPAGPIAATALGGTSMATGAAADALKGTPLKEAIPKQAGNAATVIANPVGGIDHKSVPAAATAATLTTGGLLHKAGSDAVDIKNAYNDPTKSAATEAAKKLPGQIGAGAGLGGAGTTSNALSLANNPDGAKLAGQVGGGVATGANVADQALANRPKPKTKPDGTEMTRRSLVSRKVADDHAVLMDLLVRSAEKRAAADFLRRRSFYFADEL